MKSKKILIIVLFVIGLVTLIGGIVFLVVSLLGDNNIQDGEYLVSADNWSLVEDTNCEEQTNCETGPSVIWDFTEIGKGTLTTNNHQNDYDFIWSIKDGKLLIETSWLYDINNEYDYTLNQGDGTLTLKDGDTEHVFKANFSTE